MSTSWAKKVSQSYPSKKFKLAITSLYIAKSGIFSGNSKRTLKSSPRNVFQI